MTTRVRYKRIKCPIGKYTCTCADAGGCGAFVHDYPDMIYNGLLVRDEFESNTYMLFETFAEFVTYRESRPLESQCFHEIIPGPRPQKAKLDIDYDGKDAVEIDVVKNEILKCMKYIFYYMYKDQLIDAALASGNDAAIPADFNDIAVVETKSAGVVGTSGAVKIGYHLIIGEYFMPNNIDGKLFTKLVLDMLSHSYGAQSLHVRCIDAGTDKDLQSLRLIECHKPNQTTRVKKTISYNENIDAVITLGARQMLRRSWLHADKPKSPVGGSKGKTAAGGADSTINADNAEELCTRLLTEVERASFVYCNLRGDFVNYRRIQPSYCSICKRTHEVDNTLFFVIRAGKLHKCCRRSKERVARG